MKTVTVLWLVIILGAACGWLPAGDLAAKAAGAATGYSAPASVSIGFDNQVAEFCVLNSGASVCRLCVTDAAGRLVHDSGLCPDRRLIWEYGNPEGEAGCRGLFRYSVQTWGADRRSLGEEGGWIDLTPAGGGPPLAVAGDFDVPGNYTIGGFLGVGNGSPERAAHIRGSNAVFRMDRSQDTAAFMLVRTDTAGNPLKTFVVGVNATGPGDGEFVVNDLGEQLTGGGTRRLTIDNAGTAVFSGEVRATGFVTASSARFKTNVRPLEDALTKVMQLQGVTFQWKDSGRPAIGFLAEDVGRVLPEVVTYGAGGTEAEGLDYGQLTAVLVEASKTQQRKLDELEREYQELKARLDHALKTGNDRR